MENKIYGLIGRKLGHSYSPAIHRLLGRKDYGLFELEPEELGAFLSGRSIGGVNVTIPYKRDAMAFCGRIDSRAAGIGCINTIVNEKGVLCGYNTDIDGFLCLASLLNVEAAGKKALVLGDGGTSLTARAALRELGAGEIVTVSRHGPVAYSDLGKHKDAFLIVNTTPVGMFPNCPDALVSLKDFPGCGGVIDVVYNPHRTALIMEAQSLGIPCTDGLPMLAAQAAAAEELFFGRKLSGGKIGEIVSSIRRETENIIIIGMPGSGKTSAGRALSQITGRECVDIDEEIVKSAGASIPEIFAKDGETGFRSLETETLKKFCALSGKIITTGGGTVLRPENYGLLRQNGRIYHITRDTALLATDGRPLSRDLDKMYSRRMPLYRRFADAEISNSGTVENTAGAILEDFNEHSCD